MGFPPSKPARITSLKNFRDFQRSLADSLLSKFQLDSRLKKWWVWALKGITIHKFCSSLSVIKHNLKNWTWNKQKYRNYNKILLVSVFLCESDFSYYTLNVLFFSLPSYLTTLNCPSSISILHFSHPKLIYLRTRFLFIILFLNHSINIYCFLSSYFILSRCFLFFI